jgi:hypothetical protein
MSVSQIILLYMQALAGVLSENLLANLCVSHVRVILWIALQRSVYNVFTNPFSICYISFFPSVLNFLKTKCRLL